MARAKLRNKIPQMRLALEGRLRQHHRFLLQQLRDLARAITESAEDPGRLAAASEAPLGPPHGALDFLGKRAFFGSPNT